VWGVRSVHKIKIRHERVVSFPPPVFPLPLALATTWRQLGRGANTKGPPLSHGCEREGCNLGKVIKPHKSSAAFWIVIISCLGFCLIFFFCLADFFAFAFCVLLYISACQCISKFTHTPPITHLVFFCSAYLRKQ